MKRRSAGVGLEQIGADRLREDRIVDQQRDIGAGFLAGSLPTGTDLDPGLVIAKMNAEIRCIFGISFFDRDENEL